MIKTLLTITFPLLLVNSAIAHEPETKQSSEIHFNVLGKANSPGHYTSQKTVTLLDAIATAKGIHSHGSLKNVRIIRKNGDKVTIIEVNLKAILNGIKPAPSIESGDTVYILESRL